MSLCWCSYCFFFSSKRREDEWPQGEGSTGVCSPAHKQMYKSGGLGLGALMKGRGEGGGGGGGGGGEGVVHRKSRQDMAIQKGTEG